MYTAVGFIAGLGVATACILSYASAEPWALLSIPFLVGSCVMIAHEWDHRQ